MLWQVSIEVLYVAAQSLLYGVLLFFMLGFSWQAEKFFWFLYFNFMCFLTFTLCGMMFLALSPGPQLSAILMAFISGLWSLFSGYIVPRPVSGNIPTGKCAFSSFLISFYLMLLTIIYCSSRLFG